LVVEPVERPALFFCKPGEMTVETEAQIFLPDHHQVTRISRDKMNVAVSGDT